MEKLGQSLDSDDWKDPHSLMAFYWEERELEPYGTAARGRGGCENSPSFWGAVTFLEPKKKRVFALYFSGVPGMFFFGIYLNFHPSQAHILPAFQATPNPRVALGRDEIPLKQAINSGQVHGSRGF